jgi:hypothetical protein
MATRRQARASDKGQVSPAPTVPEENASRAGGLRPAAGSGKKGICAVNRAAKTPLEPDQVNVSLFLSLPKPELLSFSSAEVFLSPGESAGSMAQRGLGGPKGATRACPVQPSTPLGPDQVNVLLL